MTTTPTRGIIAETFTSFQGEGPLAGQRCAFVRFSRCNLQCVWCDSEKTWKFTLYDPRKVSSKIPVPDLVAWVDEQNVDLLVLTGGEPLLQQRAMTEISIGVPGMRVQVETNGTLAPSPVLAARVDMWVVSPKLANSQMPYTRRIVPDALAALRRTQRAVFKFVVTDPAKDLDEISALVDEHDLAPVWVMPEARTREQVLAGMDQLHGPATARGWNVTTRLHLLHGAR